MIDDFILRTSIQVVLICFVLVVVAASIVFYIYFSRQRNKERIDELLYSDSLTKGWNLTRFQNEAEHTLKADQDQQFAMFYFDISRFKSFNAAFGFLQGDKLLIAINDLLGSFVEEDELFARITADEFVVLAKWKGWQAFLDRFEQLDRTINDLDILKSKDHRIVLIGGVSVISPEKADDATDFMISKYIDDTKYARDTVADTSRSSVVLYNPDMRK